MSHEREEVDIFADEKILVSIQADPSSGLGILNLSVHVNKVRAQKILKIMLAKKGKEYKKGPYKTIKHP